MSTKVHRVRVGMFVVVTGVLAAIILTTFAGMAFWQGREHYRIIYSGSVMGLETGARVFLNGMRVGSVDDISVAPDDLRNVRISIAVKAGTPIHADTRAMLQHAGITGMRVIDLRDGTSASPRLPPGSTIAAGQTVFDKLQEQAETLAEQSAQLMERANRIVGHLEGVDAVVENLAEASAALKDLVAENRLALRTSLVAVAETARSTSRLLDGKVTSLLTSADTLVADIKGAVHRNDTALRTAVFDLRQASRTFKDLAREVRQRPSRLLFSQPAGERKLP
jgi:phospholipid/cholesterol/gamma-HCH transport system substrate-binding protein